MLADLRQFAPPNDSMFYSVGATCQKLGINPAQLAILLEAAEVRFAKLIDGVPYLDGDGYLAVNQKAAEVIAEANATLEAAGNN